MQNLEFWFFSELTTTYLCWKWIAHFVYNWNVFLELASKFNFGDKKTLACLNLIFSFSSPFSSSIVNFDTLRLELSLLQRKRILLNLPQFNQRLNSILFLFVFSRAIQQYIILWFHESIQRKRILLNLPQFNQRLNYILYLFVSLVLFNKIKLCDLIKL